MTSYVTKKTPGDTAWFTHDRFGMFIHWGLYAMPARHEWVKTNELIPEEKYDKYFKYFDPDLYDAREWARMAKAAGMKYAVMTAKHHEGFCMFDSQYTDYKCTNTPAGRDLIREYVDAFRAEGLDRFDVVQAIEQRRFHGAGVCSQAAVSVRLCALHI